MSGDEWDLGTGGGSGGVTPEQPSWSLDNPVGSETLQGGQSQPYQAPGFWATLSGGLSKLGGTLATAAKNQGAGAAGAQGPTAGAINAQAPNLPNVGGVARNTTGAAELATLLAALDAKRNVLLQSAVSGQARPIPNPASPAAGGGTRQSTGLLGI